MLRHVLVALAIVAGAASIAAQNSAPAPGSGGAFTPARPGGGFAGPGFGGPGLGDPGPGQGAWGNPWGPGFGGPVVNPIVVNPVVVNSGQETVVACGYDAQGIWRTLPLRVAYRYNGVQYKVTVLNAWNPWTDMWNIGVDQPAYNTSYYTHGNTYDFYVPLSTGTYYFNL